MNRIIADLALVSFGALVIVATAAIILFGTGP